MLEQISGSENTLRNSFFQPYKVIFGITFRQTIQSKKTIFMLAATFIPVLIAACYRIFGRGASVDPDKVLSLLMLLLFLQFLSVLIALFYATALVADEIDNETITYLFTRPVRKYVIIIGKFAAYVLGAFLLVIPPMFFTFLIIAAGNGIFSEPILSLSHFGKQLGVTMLALTAYGAIFTFFGAWWKRPVVLGLLFGFGWEKVVLMAPGTVRRYSVVHYLMSIFPKGKLMREFERSRPPGVIPDSSPLVSIIVLLIVTGVFLGLAVFTFSRKEYKSDRAQ